MTKEFSVLIPAYNVEKYIDKCLQSILNQSFTNFEIIIIDDGSTDETLKICKKYESMDSRIKVFHQVNNGIVETRNKLIQLANGNWIVFIDADDYVKENYLSCFSNYINKFPDADVFACDYISWEKGDEFKEIKRPFHSKQEYILQLLGWRCTNTALWAKAIKKELIENNHIEFTKGISLGEDLCFMSKLFYNAKDIIYVPGENYIWNRTNVISMTKSEKYQDDVIALYEAITKFYKEKSDYKLYSKTLSNTMLHVMEGRYIFQRKKTFGNLPSLINVAQLNILNRLKFYLIINDLFLAERLVEKISRSIKRCFKDN
ncbi:glycosyltransferase family 2 protein [Marseilla massiliensis]|uniref:Glycosyltransferase family 2 protein n=1 Tax=Marseilla massiliensis TaxID=1841864 RepID=A0A938WQN1_9BACT|nr:glycosyltransferase family 2 protein [Marseilla massiliensis]MBM6662930.1 glycosyltransferase family 2 protein [Marseilla massiliensis]